MHEFETFVYLDMEKTGSTFIRQVLEKFSAEKMICRTHHEPMGVGYDPSKFYFISVRHPLEAYLSLYSFGCQSQGKVRTQLDRRGLGAVYDGTTDGFNDWLSYVLRPRYAEALGEGYVDAGDGGVAKIIGLQSYRFLKLAMPDALTILAKCANRDDVRRAYDANKLPSYFIRHETFSADLRALLRGRLGYALKNVNSALRFVKQSGPNNASKRVDVNNSDFRVRNKLMQLLREREWFLYEIFGYTNPSTTGVRLAVGVPAAGVDLGEPGLVIDQRTE